MLQKMRLFRSKALLLAINPALTGQQCFKIKKCKGSCDAPNLRERKECNLGEN